MDDAAKSVTWKVTLISTVMTLATSTAGYVSSHWGGVTLEQQQSSERNLGAKIDSIKQDVAKASDDLKKYVDEKVAAAEQRNATAKKKPKRSDASQ